MTASPPEYNASAGERPRPLAWWLAVAAVLVLGFTVRVAYSGRGYTHPDEPITVEVVQHMRSSGDWDTNWAKAGVEPGFRHDQYNFSSYLYGTFFFYRLVKILPGADVWRGREAGFFVYRFFSVVLATLAVWQTMRLGRRIGGRAIALGAGALAGMAMLLVQDAHYVRPEAFTTVLTLAVVALCWPRDKLHAGAVLAAAALIGVLIACKVSMLLLAWLPLVPLANAWPGTARRWLVLGALPFALTAGFAAGAPGAVAHPAAFLNGVRSLMTQYAGTQGPHSHIGGGPVGDMLVCYFAATLGLPVFAAFIAGIVVLVRRQRSAELAVLVGPVLCFAGYFATQSVFFERNLSHVVPLLLVVAAFGAAEVASWLAHRSGASVAITTLAVFALLLGRSVVLTQRLVWLEFSDVAGRQHADFEQELRARHPGAGWTELMLDGAALAEIAGHFHGSSAPMLVKMTDYGEEWTASILPRLTARFDAKLVADYPGTFPEVPVSTLMTYHRPRDRYYLVTGVRAP